MTTDNTMRSLSHPLRVDAGLSEIRQEPDTGAHVDQMLRQLLLTDPGERINRPDFGCGIRRMVFAPLNESAASLAQVTILTAIETFMSTVVETDKVEVKFESETIDIAIVYRLKTSGERRYLNLEVGV
ncbi:GPW/gp25 family protein [Nitratireductor sp. XY-223]|uniref:GPW/gp25 family protein n=1 Tax=Nitratireductor sp. XY-223 TaxID=2561926 RepID=UPI0010AA9A5E|nr:GPW/gp25 family protein [Nitratireductor sp. XY-223]